MRRGPNLRAVHGCVRSTLRNYQGSVRLFCNFLTNPAYGWVEECMRHFGTHPVQVVHEWNAAAHADEADGDCVNSWPHAACSPSPS